jgi:WD40 repeat protein
MPGNSAYFAKDGRIVTALAQDEIILWDPGAERQMVRLRTPGEYPQAAILSPDEQFIVSIAPLARKAIVRRIRDGTVLAQLTNGAMEISAVAWDGTGTQLARATANGAVRIYNLIQKQETFVLPDYTMRWDQVFWEGANRVIAFSRPTGVLAWYPLPNFRDVDRKQFVDARTSAISLNNIALGFNDGHVTLVDHAGNLVHKIEGPASAVTHLEFDSSGRRLLICYVGAQAHIYSSSVNNVWTLDRVLQHDNSVLTAVWSPEDSRVATGSSDGTARLWDANTGNPLSVLRGHMGAVRAITWSQRGVLATGGDDRRVRIWDAYSGAQLSEFDVPRGAITDLKFNPSGLTLATASNDGTVHLLPWKAAPSQEQPDLARSRAVRELTREERRQAFLPSDQNAATLVGLNECDRLAAHPSDPRRTIGSGVPFSKISAPQAVKACEDAVEKAPLEPRYRFQLGRAFETSGQYTKAVRAYKDAAESEYPMALNNLAALYLEGTGVERNPTESARLLFKAEASGISVARFTLGNLFWEGNGVPRDRARAVALWEKGADANEPHSHEELGWVLEVGRDGNPANPPLAFRHYAIATNEYEKSGDTNSAAQSRIRRGTLARGLLPTVLQAEIDNLQKMTSAPQVAAR